MIVPGPAPSGSTIGIIAPAGAVRPDALAAGAAVVESWGYRVRLGAHVQARHGYCAGTAAERARDLAAMLTDPDVTAILCARGGYGAAHVLPLLDPALVRANPKWLCGYSDVSPLVGWFADRGGVAALHGPMVASDLAHDLAPRGAARLRAILVGEDGAWREAVPDVVVPGRARGRLVGGCLSSLCALLGTPYAVDTRDAVVFLEDVAERPFRLDRMLTQLRLAGKLDRVAGVILGAFSDCDGPGAEDRAAAVFRTFFAGADYPVVAGFPAGHRSANLPLVVGLPLTIDTERGVVEAGAR